MTTGTRYLKTFWQLLANPTPEQREVLGEGRPFMITLTLILGITSIIVIYNTPALTSPPRLLAFIVVIGLHISLHWFSGFSAQSNKKALIYLITQGCLGLTATLLSGSPTISLAVFASMIGETIGTFGMSRLTWLAISAFLILTPIGYWLVGGQEMLIDWMSPTISTMIMLIVFMVLFRKQLDTSQQAQALADELESANRQLAAYAAQVEELTLASERQRMARELHDTLAQGVAGLVLQLEAVKAHLGAGRGERASAIIEQSLTRARSTLADSRAAIDDLRSAPANLPDAVRAKVERFTQATGIPCDLDLALDGNSPVPTSVSGHIQRVLSEVLANITRHAQATHVWVDFHIHEDQLILEIRDNGRGFDPASVNQSGHYGLLGMRERARLVGGRLTLTSEKGIGTQVQLHVPLHAKGEDT